MKQAPLRGLRCFPRESTGSMSGSCGWAFPHSKSPETVRGHTTSLRRYGPGPPACAERTTLLLNQAYPTAILTSAADVATITGAASLGRLAIRTGSPPG
jgi:hypothetical protein